MYINICIAIYYCLKSVAVFCWHEIYLFCWKK